MNAAVVVDVGNTRIKWGRCGPAGVVESVALPDDLGAWHQQRNAWRTGLAGGWAVTGVHPERVARLVDWLRAHAELVHVIDTWRQLPLRVALEHPERVGLDRLFNAVAANERRSRGIAAVLVDAGSAVTVDWLDEEGTFRGGAIFPGLRLMARALHDYTALLPDVEVARASPPVPGASTVAAIEAGVFWAVVGGIQALGYRLAQRAARAPEYFLTGGDGPLLGPALEPPVAPWPRMTLEGIRLTAESVP